MEPDPLGVPQGSEMPGGRLERSLTGRNPGNSDAGRSTTAEHMHNMGFSAMAQAGSLHGGVQRW